MENRRRMQSNEKKTKKSGGYTPFQKVILALSILLIMATVAVSAVYILQRGKPAVKLSDRNGEGTQAETQSETEENWDGVSLKKTQDAGQKYVSDTLFVGDSNFRRLDIYGLVDARNVIGMSEKGIQNALYDRETYLNGYTEAMSVADAIARIAPSRVLLNFGTNNLAGDADNFVSVYADFIRAVRNAAPDVDIIVMSIPPVSGDISTSFGTLTIDDVDSFNAALKETCRELEVPYLNVTDDCLKDPETGVARSEIMYSDGIHIEANGLRDLIDYYRNHAYQPEKTRSTTGFTTYVVDAPEKPEGLDCDRLLSDITVRLVSAGYSMAMSGDDLQGLENTYSYTVPADADKDSLDQYSKEVYNFISGRCSTDSKLKISWYDTESGSHVFSITEYLICAEHKYGDWEIIEASTCSKEGKRKHTCTVCGFEEEATYGIDPTNHTYEWEVLKEATCEEDGERRGICTGCGNVLNDYIDATGHTEVITIEGHDATCTEPGYTSQIECSVCGEILQYSYETEPALGHDWYDDTDDDGDPVHVCSRCGERYYD